MSFVHLHTHSEYSLTDGLPRISNFVSSATDKNFSAAALTDIHNLFAAVKFYTQAIQQGIKPIIGCEVRLDVNLPEVTTDCSVVLLCLNQTGYQNLMKLLSESYLSNQDAKAKVTYQQLQQYNKGLIALSGGIRGDLGQVLLTNRAKVEKTIHFWKKCFPDRYYLEIFRTGREQEDVYSDLAIEAALMYQLPVVATNDVCFLEEKDFDIHEARVCIANGEILSDETRSHNYSNQQYLKDKSEMAALFKDIPEALENAAEIAKRCTVNIETGKILLPKFPLPEGSSVDQTLRQQVQEGMRSCDISESDFSAKDYQKRLDSELEIIANMNYEGYFLIVADFVHWAEENEIPVGPGRGSGAGSLVAYVLGITKIDPLQYNLLFERFLNPERVSMPDFDIDFCMEKRDQVIEYVSNRYGRDKVSQIITFGSMAAKAVVRDVGRIQGQPYGFVDQIAKLVPNDLNITLDLALKSSPELKKRYKEEPAVAAIIDTGKQLEGLSRNPGKHAGGVVIAPNPLTEYTALYCDSGDQDTRLSQFDMKDLEKIGLVKFDFLGLKTLTVIERAVRAINKQNGQTIDIAKIPLDDEGTYQLLQRAQTKSIFQLESSGARSLLKRLIPNQFEDLVAMMALYRPGPLKSGMVDDYIKRKHGESPVEYPHPSLEEILKPTYGVILYQEQVMQIAQKMSGYSLGNADLLRRAMGKKLVTEMAEQRDVFNNGAEANDVSRSIANRIFDSVEKFAEYGFNRSHSVGYGLIAYRTAWLKAHYPAAFMAAVLSTEMRFVDKLVESIYECRLMDITILPPDINISQWEFTMYDERTIRYGFGAIRHVGLGIANEIITERESEGEFTSLYDFCVRMMSIGLKNSILHALVTAGAMDLFESSRALMLASLEATMTLANQRFSDMKSGQTNLFGSDDKEKNDLPEIVPDQIMRREEVLKKEKESLGIYLSDHPLSDIKAELDKMPIGGYEIYCDGSHNKVWFAGIVASVSRKRGRTGTGVFFTLDDKEHYLEFAAFGNTYMQYKNLLKEDEILFVCAKNYYDARQENQNWRINEVLTLAQARQQFAKEIHLKITAAHDATAFIETLKTSVKPFIDSAGCSIRMTILKQEASADMILAKKWNVRVSSDLLDQLNQIEEIQSLKVIY